jgi:hypothetical protein
MVQSQLAPPAMVIRDAYERLGGFRKDPSLINAYHRQTLDLLFAEAFKAYPKGDLGPMQDAIDTSNRYLGPIETYLLKHNVPGARPEIKRIKEANRMLRERLGLPPLPGEWSS